ncbi:GNAT family N-acetyltransferase [Paraflavitalea soli]|uniref:GNAT family N-acetyltransferase n=1 Tax=Paraflavitalea soli TaxID=2315862 RepID=A0A3B7MU86_9BACT|nr:GNAT family N-acetyltransferase [Paraflavitalea soli]AXY75185.1 GNAT family N-acetyltransferase [Paraflavitalea soli]
MSNHSIQYLQRAQIDTVKWDNCLAAAPNGLIYGYSFYLDRMAVDWDALVLNDYEAVMPLPWKKKWGTSYLAHPPITASLGIFGTAVTPALTGLFIQAIPPRFKLVDLLLNPANFLPTSQLQSIRNNYVLDLQSTYADIYSHYRNNVRRNIKKAQQLNCRYAVGIQVEEVIRLAHWQIQQQATNIGEEDYAHFKDLFHYLLSNQAAEACGVYTPNDELVASCVWFYSKARAYYILVGNHPNGKTLGASHYLIDRFIEAHAGQELILDFEGSDIASLAFFYSSFGAVNEAYPALQFQRLPWWLQWKSKGYPKINS